VVDERDRLRRIRQLEAEQATALAKAEAKLSNRDAKYVRDPNTGLSPAQVEARKLVEEAAANAAQYGIEGKVVTPKGRMVNVVENTKSSPSGCKL
jgi:gamma-glutamyl:cysteine ligase YbdK (ATP-grasp superfamily)